MKNKIVVLSLLVFLTISITFVVSGLENRAEVLIIDDLTIEVGEEVSFSKNFPIYVTEDEKDNLVYNISDEDIVYVTKDLEKVIGLMAGTTLITVSSDIYYSEFNITVSKDNLFANGNLENFEVGDNYWVEQYKGENGWLLYTGGSTIDQTIEVVEEDGNKFFHFYHDKDTKYTNLYYTLSVEPGEYYVTADMKGENVAKNTYVRVNQGGSLGSSQTPGVTGTFDWTTYTSGVVTVADGETLKLECYFALNSGDVYFDNIEVYRVISKDYDSFAVEQSTVSLEVNETSQIVCTTYPQTIISYNFDYYSVNENVAIVSKTGLITAVSTGYTKINVYDQLNGSRKTINVLVGTKNGLNASFNNGEVITVDEDSTNTFTLDISDEVSYEIYKYTNPKNGSYYIKDNSVVYSPNYNYYSLEETDIDTFEVVVFSEELGYTFVEFEVYVQGFDDEVTYVDYWHSVDKNSTLEWVENTTSNKNHVSGDLAYGGYLEIVSNDIEVFSSLASGTKASMYQEIYGTSLEGTTTITTSNGGTVDLLFNGNVQQIQDRYYSSNNTYIYGVMYNYTAATDFVGYDTFELRVVSGDTEVILTNTVYVAPSTDDFEFDTLDFDGIYLLSNDEWIEESRLGYLEGDEYITKWVAYYESFYSSHSPQANPALSRTPLEQLAILYAVTGNSKYLEMCWNQMEVVVKDAEFSGDGTERLSWGQDSNGFLDAAMVTYSVSFAYNYIKEDLTDEQQQMVMEALYEEGFYWFETISNVNVLLHGNNHNLLVCANLALAAFSAMSYDGSITSSISGEVRTINMQEVAAQTIIDAFKYLQIALVHYSPTGGFPEGPSYSYYGHRNVIYLLATLDNLYGRDDDGVINSFGLSEVPGIMNYANYPVYSSTPNYESFYYAESLYSNNQPGLLWYTRVDETDTTPAILSKLADANEQYNIISLLWYKPGLFEQINLQELEQTDMLLEDHELATFRQAFDNEYSVFAGLKGVETDSGVFTHKNLDSGTFEFYAFGEQFIGNFSNETYDEVVPDGYWDYSFQRWTYYKKSAQGQNTLVFNPESNPVLQQDPYANAPITAFESNNTSGFAVVDLSEVYQKDALSVQRGMMLYDNKSTMVIQDEFSLRSESTVYWSAHTEANISIISDKIAKLTLNGKSVYVQITSEIGSFSKSSATALPGTVGLFCNLDNKGVNKLLIELNDIVEGTLTVVFTPTLSSYEEINDYEITAIDDWQLQPEENKENITVNNISMDAKYGGTYSYKFNPNQYQYVVQLDKTTLDIPKLTVDYDSKIYNVEIQYSKLFSETTKVIVTNKETKNSVTYEYKYIVDSITDNLVYGEYITYDIVGVRGSVGVDAMVDGSSTTYFQSTDREEVVFELDDVRNISNVLIRFNGGLLNKYYFDIYYSVDGVNYSACYLNGESTNQMGDEVFSIGNIDARYVKIVFNGNNDDYASKVAEVSFLHNNYIQNNEPTNNILVIAVVTTTVLLVIGFTTIFVVKSKRRK